MVSACLQDVDQTKYSNTVMSHIMRKPAYAIC